MFSSGVCGVYACVCVGWGTVLGITLRSSCLQDKHFINWVISSVLRLDFKGSQLLLGIACRNEGKRGIRMRPEVVIYDCGKAPLALDDILVLPLWLILFLYICTIPFVASPGEERSLMPLVSLKALNFSLFWDCIPSAGLWA